MLIISKSMAVIQLTNLEAETTKKTTKHGDT